MDARKEPRSTPAESVEVVVLGEGRACLRGEVLDVSARGMALRLPSPLPAGSAVKIECNDTLILGDLSYCIPHDGAFRAGLVVKHRLVGLAELHRLNRALHGVEQTETAVSPILSPIMKG